MRFAIHAIGPPSDMRPVWKKVLIVMGVGGMLITVTVVGGLWWLLRRAHPGASGAGSSEARIQVLSLCNDVSAYQSESGTLLRAGPQPREVPRGRAVPFPRDEAFEKLGFDPGPEVRYQYEVAVETDPL